MIDAEAFEELISEVTALLRVSDRLLAKSCEISPSTLRNWKTDGISPGITKTVAYRKFEAYMRNGQKTIASNEIGRGPTAVDAEVSQRIAVLYEQCLKNSQPATAVLPVEVSNPLDENIEEPDSSRGSQQSGDILTQFGTISVYANLTRWRDRDVSSEPFESKVVGMGAIRREEEVYDELVLFSHNSILQTQSRSLPILLRTSGVLEVTNIDNEQFLLDREIHEQTEGRVLPLHLQISRLQREIRFVERIYNGFQRGNEDLAIRVFDNSTASLLHITVDFSSVLTYSRFLETPTAQYIALGESGRPVSTRNLLNGNIWYVVFEHPQPGSRLQMSWSLK